MILDDVAAHYRAHWCAPSRTASYRFSGHAVQVLKWDANKNPEQVNVYATVGASAHVETAIGGAIFGTCALVAGGVAIGTDVYMAATHKMDPSKLVVQCI